MRPLARAAGCSLLALCLCLRAEVAPAQYGGGAAAAEKGSAEGEAKPKSSAKEKRRWGSKRTEKKWGKSQAVRERTGKRLAAAAEFLQAEHISEAEAELSKIRLRSLNEFEQAKYHQIAALLANAKRDSAGARKHLEQALALDALSVEDQAQVRYQIAGLLLGEEKWDEAISNLEQWFAVTEEPTPTAYYLMALAHYQMEDLVGALEPAQKAVDLGDPPTEGSFQLLLAIRLTRAGKLDDEAEKLREYQAAEPILLELVRRYPKKIYWLQLSTLYGAQEDFDRALVYLELANHQGLLEGDEEIKRLAQLLLARDLPWPAAKLLEMAFAEKKLGEDANAFELLSTAWIQARDLQRALPPLRRAAELSTDGKLFIRLAQVHLQREEFAETEEALRRALDKGGLPSVGEAQLLMGIALFSQGRSEPALTWFGRAREHASSRDEAEIWLKHIEQQLLAVAARSDESGTATP